MVSRQPFDSASLLLKLRELTRLSSSPLTSGKSTQLPSFLLEDQLSKGKPCKIYVTEPRTSPFSRSANRLSAH
jgi:hypothetical protein